MKTLLAALKSASKRKESKIIEIKDGRIYATDLDSVVIGKVDFQQLGIFDSTQFCGMYKTNLDGLHADEGIYYHNQVPLTYSTESKLDVVINGLPNCDKLLASLTPNQLAATLTDSEKWMAKNDVRYYLNGLKLSFDKQTNRIESAASNGHTLSVNDVEVNTVFTDGSYILNRSSIELLKSLKPSSTIDIWSYESDDENRPAWVKFVVDDVEIYAKTHDSKYPDFSKVFTQPFDVGLKINVKESLTQLNGIKPLLTETKGISLYSEADGKVALFIDNNLLCGLSMTSSKPIEVGFGYEYLINLLKRPTNETTTFTLAADASCVISETEIGSNKYTSVVMAMRL
jgi:DNA polymerase III sliding clamp (beta) subunit (PCNA family)